MKGLPLLAVLAALVFAGFAIQRGRSAFLGIEADAALAREVAAASGLTVHEVMALRELCGAGLPKQDLTVRAGRLVADRERIGEPLAVAVAAGDAALVGELLSAANGDAAAAAGRLRRLPEGLAAVRFAAMRDRFASRAAR
ncbi:MAG: hypothetical protein HZB39_04235 [Planctomycetes bacterium]|nr:hypothetical protein [Planctomycetota bacterium]